MSSNPASSAYFCVEPLKSRFAANLSRALREQLINDQEYQQLGKLLSAADSEVFVGSGLRVDQLMVEDGTPMADEWSDALVISPVGAGDSQVYLDTLLHGLKRFPNRSALLNALEGDIPTAVKPAFELRLIEGDLFEQRMQRVIDHQVERLRELSTRLRHLPSLDWALSTSLRQHAGTSLPEAASTLSTPLVQVSGAGTASSAVSLRNQTLVQTASDRLAGQPLPVSRRSYLRANGQVVDATHSKHYDQWLVDAVSGLIPVYESLLGDYWQHRDASGQTPRALAASGVAAGFRQALLHGQHTGFLGAEEFTLLSSLLDPASGNAKSSIVCKRLSLVVNGRQPLKLVGLISMADHSLPDLFVYSALHGIRRFASYQALADHYGTRQGRSELQVHLSFNEYPLLNLDDALNIQAYALEHPVFMDAIDAIIALQKRNLGLVLAGGFIDAASAAAKIDDALDVRHLIDRRLASFDDGGRWLRAPGAFAQRWSLAPLLTPARDALSDLTWTQRIAELAQKIQWLDRTPVGIGECARQMLNEYLAILPGPPLDASDLCVRAPSATPADEEDSLDAQPSESATTLLTLVDFALEKASGYRTQRLPLTASVASVLPGHAPPEPVPTLTPEVINLMVARVSSTLEAQFMKRFARYANRPVRSEVQQLIPAEVAKGFLSDVLRLEYELQVRFQKIASRDLQMLEQVINRPTRSMRLSQGDEHVEVYSVYLDIDANQEPVLISNLFVMHRPVHSHEPFLCWSAVSGVETFRSAAALRGRLDRRLFLAASRERWLALISEPQRDRVRTHLEQPDLAPLGLQFNRIDDDFIEALLQVDLRLQRNNVEQALQRALQAPMPAQVLERLTLMARSDERKSCSLDTLAAAIQRQVLESTLPLWLSAASIDDLGIYVGLLQQFYLNDNPGETFLPYLPSLQGFAREQLINYLNMDYPHQVPDPDLITVTFTQYLPSPVPIGETPSAIPAATVVNRESLTQFALNHFSNVEGAVLMVRFPDDLPIPEFIAPGYFKALVHRLDVGKHYRDLLAAKSEVDSPGYRIGLRRFIARIPARMLLVACEMKLQKQLSAQAYDCLQNLLDMPDSVAREAALDQNVTLRPMRLLAAAGLRPDPVLGVYLIGPVDERRGPIVVHALFNESFTFKEYAGMAELLLDLQAPGILQTLVLGRVDPALRKRYDHGGFREAHIPWSTEGYLDGPTQSPGPTLLVGEPVSGNILHYLFDQTLEVLKDICRKQTVTTAEDDWKSLVNLMSLGAEQVLSFLPGHLGLMLAAWQSHSLFKASADSAYARRWGQALSEFTAALGVLMVNRQHAHSEHLVTELSQREQVPTEPGRSDLSQDEVLTPDFSWNNPVLISPFRSRLKALEVREIALHDLEYDSLLNLYTDPHTQSQYAAIGGRVYCVTADTAQWRVVGPNGEQGPLVRLDVNQQWQFDLRLGLRGGGGRQTHFQSLESRDSVDHILIVEAQGMSEIRAVYHERASMIVEANVQARRYLENCLFNLVPVRRGILQGRTNHLICEFFGVRWLPPVLLTMLRDKVRKLYLAVTDPSLTSLSSRRYVVGSNKPGNESTAAFISTSDPEKRIYLTERFFDAPGYSLKDPAQLGGFSALAHYRAGTLIHEMAHLFCDAHDIADLDSSAPFPDLLDDSHPASKAIKDELSTLRATALSHNTPADRLFRKHDSSGWRDITDEDGAMKASILRITGTTSLAKARDVFLNDPQKRSEVILSNADSVAVLVMNLGRMRVLPETGSSVSITSGDE